MSPTPEPVDLSDPLQLELAVRIGVAWIQLRRGAAMSALRDQLFGTGDDAIEQGQMDTLDVLAMQPSWRMSDLAEALRVDPSTATRAVQRLVRAGLANRSASDDDGRVVMVAISDAGARRHAEVAERRGRLMAFLLARYTIDERQQLADLLERFVAGVDEYVGDRPAPLADT